LVLGECPFCHKLFAAKEISKEQVDSDVVAKEATLPRIAVRRRPLKEPPQPGVPGRISLVYKITYQCKHCRKEWTKISEEDVEIPHEYLKEGED
jgi:hypothetical protein